MKARISSRPVRLALEAKKSGGSSSHSVSSCFFIAGGTAFELVARELVRLGEDDAERNAVFAQQPDEPQIDRLRFEPRVDQHEEEVHLLRPEHVVGDEFREFAPFALRDAGVAVARQVDQIPAVVDQEMVDEPCLTRRSRYFGQRTVAGEQVDERRLADVAAPDEGDVGQCVARNLRQLLRAAFEGGAFDLHADKDSASRVQKQTCLHFAEAPPI